MSSTLDPAGTGAVEVARLFWVMTGSAVVIWLALTVLLIHAARTRTSAWSDAAAVWLISIGGAGVPTIALALLLFSGMPMLSRQLAAAPPDALRVHVVGEQWWWRISYELDDGRRIEVANELRLPRGRSAALTLGSADVIHSFWVPSLAGKIDMIPGRTTRLTLEPEAGGTFRGACAEYCGASHAHMAFVVVVMEPADFAAWLDGQAQPAMPADGGQTFTAVGCGACHTVRGTEARGTIGPDLTHVGSRLSLAAGTLSNSPAELERWIANPQHIKPAALMPPFGMLPPDDVRRLAAYLQTLR